MGPHGGRRMTAAAMINQCKKLHRAENLSFCSFSAFCTYTTATHHAAMMFQIGGRKEATNLAWRLPRRRLGSRPPWLGGACLLANLPSKNMLTTTQQRLLTRSDIIGRQRLPWCSTPLAATYNSQPTCWQIVACGNAGSGAPWRVWDNGSRHG